MNRLTALAVLFTFACNQESSEPSTYTDPMEAIYGHWMLSTINNFNSASTIDVDEKTVLTLSKGKITSVVSPDKFQIHHAIPRKSYAVSNHTMLPFVDSGAGFWSYTWQRVQKQDGTTYDVYKVTFDNGTDGEVWIDGVLGDQVVFHFQRWEPREGMRIDPEVVPSSKTHYKGVFHFYFERVRN